MSSVQDQGTVVGCNDLPILDAPNGDAEFVAWLPMLTQVMIDHDKSTEDFYKIYTATSLEGYCEKKYIAIPLE